MNFTWPSKASATVSASTEADERRVRSIPNSTTRNSAATAMTAVSVSTTTEVNVTATIQAAASAGFPILARATAKAPSHRATAMTSQETRSHPNVPG